MKSPITKLKSKNIRFKLIVCLVGLLFLGIGGLMIYHLTSKPNGVAQAAITREQAIPKSQEYLLKNLKSMDPTLRLLLDYLYRKFNINSQFSGQINQISTTAEDPLVQHELKSIARFAYKEELVTDLGPNPSLVAQGANCERIPLPGNISTLLQQEINKGSYEMSQAFLALQLMKELNCSVPNVESLRSQTITAMVNLAGNEKTLLDLRYECIALLLYAGKLDTIDPTWIDQIYAAQHLDGGWSVDKSDPKSDEHTSVLALWALLEYNQPNTPYEPVIHKASNE